MIEKSRLNCEHKQKIVISRNGDNDDDNDDRRKENIKKLSKTVTMGL